MGVESTHHCQLLRPIISLVSLCEKGSAAFCMSRWRQWPDWWQRPRVLPTSLHLPLFPRGSCSFHSVTTVCVTYGIFNPNQQCCCSARPNSLTNITRCTDCAVISSPAALTKNTALRRSDNVSWKNMSCSNLTCQFFITQTAPLCLPRLLISSISCRSQDGTGWVVLSLPSMGGWAAAEQSVWMNLGCGAL